MATSRAFEGDEVTRFDNDDRESVINEAHEINSEAGTSECNKEIAPSNPGSTSPWLGEEIQVKISELREQVQAEEGRLQEAQERVSEVRLQLESAAHELQLQREVKERAEEEIEELLSGPGPSGQPGERRSVLEQLMGPLASLRDQKDWEKRFRSDCKARRAEILGDIARIEGEIAKQRRGGVEGGSLEAAKIAKLDEEIALEAARHRALRRELGQRNRAIAALQRRLDSMPTQGELVQYERRFVELYEHVQRKLQETRRYYAKYNMLMDANKFTLKEISLLDSIHSQFESAMSSPTGRLKLVDSMDTIGKGVQKNVEKAEQRLQQELMALADANDRHSSLVSDQRRYFASVKEFQEECAKGERLKLQLANASQHGHLSRDGEM